MEKTARILFVATDFGSFVDNDYHILKKHFLVKRIDTWQWKRKIKKGRYLLSTIFHLGDLYLEILKSDIIFIWFANVEVHLILKIAKMFNKKTIVVIGGGEVAHESEINYGRLLDDKYREKIEYILKNVDRIVAVSTFSTDEILKLDSSAPVEMIYNCVDTDLFRPAGIKEQIVLSIAYVKDHNHVILKGLDILCQSAALLPAVRFRIIGIEGEAMVELKKIAPRNVEILPPASKDQIIRYFQNALVYCQLSYRESFGMALVEAMACECVPVVSSGGALPEIVGEYGYIVPYHDSEKTADAIIQALNSYDGPIIRKMVEEKYSMTKKEGSILKLIHSLARVNN